MELTNESILTTKRPLTINHKAFRKAFRNKLMVSFIPSKEVVKRNFLAILCETLFMIELLAVFIMIYFC
ncbi:hypothetical protein [uncultured Clostridium sp.]|uniref:hypothetical protein n=1 Tax=uncultured Clostridium sp. TaxID=59620 RepID=UPI003216E44E